jgi:hypothetical protein
MVRTLLCAVVALALGAGLGLAADKGKKGHTYTGKIKKLDTETGTLTLTVKKKEKEKDREFTIGADTKVVVYAGDDKKELTGKDRLKNEQFKEGAAAAVVTDADGKITEVWLGTFPAKKKKQG